MRTTGAYRVSVNLAKLEANTITVKNSNSAPALTKGRILFHMQAVWGKLGLAPTNSSYISMSFNYADDYQSTQKQMEEALTTKSRISALKPNLQNGWRASQWCAYGNSCSCTISRSKQAPKEGQESLLIELSEIISFCPGKTTKIRFDFYGFEKEGCWSSEYEEITIEKVAALSVGKLNASKYTLRRREREAKLRWQTLEGGKLKELAEPVDPFDDKGAWQTFERPDPDKGEETSIATLFYMPPQIKTEVKDDKAKVEVTFSDQTIISVDGKPIDTKQPGEFIGFDNNLRIRCSGYFYSVDHIIYKPENTTLFDQLIQTVYLFNNGSRLLRLEWSSDKEIQFYIKGTSVGKDQIIDKGKQGEWEYLFGHGNEDYFEIIMVDKNVVLGEAFRLII